MIFNRMRIYTIALWSFVSLPIILLMIFCKEFFAENLLILAISVYVISAVLLAAINYLISKRDSSSMKYAKNKILDSSAIVDGRILDILNTGFLEGNIIIPGFVLIELQKLADSENHIKRAKGRKALDLVKLIQREARFPIMIINKDYDNIRDVDTKIIKLAKDLNSEIITTDYNLKKVANIQGIMVLNINKLTNALKMVVIPNEEIYVQLVKKGDKYGQAIGYLDDGTMVVVEDGLPYLGEKSQMIVTSMYPTAAGRMVFGKIKK